MSDTVTPAAVPPASTAAAAPPAPNLGLQRDGQVQRYDVAFPMLTVKAEKLTLPDYVEVLWERERECLRTDRKTRAQGSEKLGVSPSAFGGVELPRDATATWVRATEWRWHRTRFGYDRSLRLAILGLLLATTGVAIDASLKLGETSPLISVPDPWYTVLIVLKYALQGVGLLLAFWKGVLDGSR